MFALQSNNREGAQGARHFPNNCAILGRRSHRVRVLFRFAIIAVLISNGILSATARKRPSREPSPKKANIEAAARLQIFLDRANFSPGKLDGTYNEFTWKALGLYRQSRGEQPQLLHKRASSNRMLRPTLRALTSTG